MAENSKAKMEDEDTVDFPSSTHCERKYFLDVPAEIRAMIYDLVLSDEYTIEPEHLVYYPDIGLLRVNRHVSMEASQRFHGINSWFFDSIYDWDYENAPPSSVDGNRMLPWMRQIGQNANLIHRACYLYGPSSELECQRAQFELAALRPLVPNLRHLTFIWQRDLWNHEY
ncbi:hypothetical protein VTJ04DRAFT_10363 [Mycothermus thermophilus]|uniref:uncharacterized protein n=1 Tax=Humicola insolens TaxID=85995 RepID=UPI00374200B7